MRPAKYFYDKPLPKYLDPKTVLIYRPHPVDSLWVTHSHRGTGSTARGYIDSLWVTQPHRGTGSTARGYIDSLWVTQPHRGTGSTARGYIDSL